MVPARKYIRIAKTTNYQNLIILLTNPEALKIRQKIQKQTAQKSVCKLVSFLHQMIQLILIMMLQKQLLNFQNQKIQKKSATQMTKVLI